MRPPTERLTISWEAVQHDTQQLIELLKPRGRWHRLIAVARGGLVPATLVAHALGIRHIDTLCLSRYDDHVSDTVLDKTPPKIIKTAAETKHQADGHDLLIVDDLVDSGVTGRLIKHLYPMAHLATLYAKPLGRSAADTFVKEYPQHVWIDFPWESRDP